MIFTKLMILKRIVMFQMFLSVLHLGCKNFHKYWTPCMQMQTSDMKQILSITHTSYIKKLYILLNDILNDKQ